MVGVRGRLGGGNTNSPGDLPQVGTLVGWIGLEPDLQQLLDALEEVHVFSAAAVTTITTTVTHIFILRHAS